MTIDLASVRRAYRRHAPYYDLVFGVLLQSGRRRTVECANRLPSVRLLEVGVGTGLALPHYRSDKRIVGVDISPDMLRWARRRVIDEGLANVEALLEMDAERLEFEDDSFDIVVAMYVASVVPNPPALLGEMQRVCRPGGDILVVNHFADGTGLRGVVERRLAPLSAHLGWRPDFALQPFLGAGTVEVIERLAADPFGFATLVHCRNDKSAA